MTASSCQARVLFLLTVIFKLCSSQNQVCLDDRSLRLVNGLSELEGMVEVCMNSFWKAVCSGGEFEQIVHRLCDTLGFSEQGAESYVVNKSENIAGFDVSYRDEGLQFTLSSSCTGARLRCQPRTCANGDVRQTGNVTEVCINETWLAISPESNNITKVVCRQQGFSLYGGKVNTVNLNSNHYDVVSLTCTGKEEHLSQCDSSRGTNNEILSVTCQQKCYLCKDESTPIQVQTRGTGTLTISWNLAGILPLSSLLSYSVTCRPAQPAAAPVDRPHTEISMYNINSNTNSIELSGIEAGLFNHTCCVTAQRLNFSTRVFCTTSSSRVSGIELSTAEIAGIAAGLPLGVFGITMVLVLTITVVCYKKKRFMSSKRRKRNKICASLNDVFSKSGQVTAATSMEDIGSKKAKEQLETTASAPLAKLNSNLVFREEILTSQCVAYTPTATADQVPPQAYEDISLSVSTPVIGVPGGASEAPELPQRNRKDA